MNWVFFHRRKLLSWILNEVEHLAMGFCEALDIVSEPMTALAQVFSLLIGKV